MDRQDRGSIGEIQSYRLNQMLGQDAPIDDLSFAEAKRLIRLHDPNAPWRLMRPTPSQRTFLWHRGRWREGLTRGEASRLIGEIKEREKGA
jgi:hypothetical protein